MSVWIDDPDPACPHCHGTGWVNQQREPGSDIWDAHECPCTVRGDGYAQPVNDGYAQGQEG